MIDNDSAEAQPTDACLGGLARVAPSLLDPEVTAEDQAIFEAITRTELTPVEVERIRRPARTFPKVRHVLAVHWHPENIPMELFEERLDAMFPNRESELIIPTQHNVLMSRKGLSGVEVDCYSHGFNRKVQLLLHFKEDSVANATVLRNMLDHTFKYRSSQLYEYLDTIVDPRFDHVMQRAARDSNADEDMVAFSRVQASKLKSLLENNELTIAADNIKNKLVRNFFDALRPKAGHKLVERTQVFLKAVKEIVKDNFSLTYFYRASEVIEEVRGLGGGVVIPHPEQFWPILMADYDVDGIEVWNPQSQMYTDFLIKVVDRQNRTRPAGEKPILVLMGDDCHLSEKLKDPAEQNPEKASREVGLQPAWNDLTISKTLILAGITAERVIREYRERLGAA